MKGGISLEGVSFLKVVQKEADSAGDGELAGGPTGVQSAQSPSALLPRKVGEPGVTLVESAQTAHLCSRERGAFSPEAWCPACLGHLLGSSFLASDSPSVN